MTSDRDYEGDYEGMPGKDIDEVAEYLRETGQAEGDNGPDYPFLDPYNYLDPDFAFEDDDELEDHEGDKLTDA